MRIGFVITDKGFAAVLYQRVLSDAKKRSPWFQSVGDAAAYGIAWAEDLGVAMDVVRVDTRLLSYNPAAANGGRPYYEFGQVEGLTQGRRD